MEKRDSAGCYGSKKQAHESDGPYADHKRVGSHSHDSEQSDWQIARRRRAKRRKTQMHNFQAISNVIQDAFVKVFSHKYIVNKPLADIEEMLVVQEAKEQGEAEIKYAVNVKAANGETLN